MPRKDPMTGVPVMTTMEFFQRQAEDEGKGRTAGDVMSDFLTDFENERRNEEQRLRTPKEMEHLLKDLIKEENEYNTEYQLPLDFKVLEVLELKYKQTFRDSSIKALVKVKRGKLKEFNVYLSTWHSFGTMWEPPDSETDIVFDWKGGLD
jgi:hypothetical protein